MSKKMFLIDGSNHAFRVQFALPPMHAADGFPTRALYGFTTLFAKLLREHQPDYVAVSFDKGKTFRHERFPEYKGHRPDMPEDLRQQWPHFPELVEGFGYPCVMQAGYEADDVIGTLATRFASDDLQVFLVTGDKDFAQIVNENVVILDLMKDKVFDTEAVIERFGVGPDRIIDLLGLIGDKSDNIPGIQGIGPKKGAQYLQKYGSLEGVLENWKDIGGKTGERVRDSADDARLSKELATIVVDVDLGLELEDLAPKGLQIDALRVMFDRWEFGRVARKLLPEEPVLTPSSFRSVTTSKELAALDAELREEGTFAVDLELDDLGLAGVSVSWGPTDVVYVPLRQRFGSKLDHDEALKVLGALLSDKDLGKVLLDSKAAWHALKREGIVLDGIAGDVVLADYVLVSHETHTLESMCDRYLGHALSKAEAVQALFADVITVEEQTKTRGEQVSLVWMLHRKIVDTFDEGTASLYTTIELPLVPVLAEMEHTGIRLDLSTFATIQSDLDARVVELVAKAHEMVGREFNLNSRKELTQILFEELELPVQKKTKTGPSTDASVLEALSEMHELPAIIVEYRKLTKLLSTYVQSLPNFVKEDGRVHSTFNQAVAATGRLSSQDPNLQNIPIRTFEGRRIREAFVPQEGWSFLSADYSQVELRVLAHFVGEGPLCESFRSGADIHARTASELFEIPIGEVTGDHRSAAKAINFGLLYGMSAFRLGRDLGISRTQAQQWMDDYFGRMPQVKDWIEATKASASDKGYVTTLFGRRRMIQAIHSKRFQERAAAEREAVNTPVQGTAADLIKIAMIRVDTALREAGLRARMVLQVHDELLLEVPDEELAKVGPLVKAEMMGAADLAVPLDVNVAVGATWNAAHG